MYLHLATPKGEFADALHIENVTLESVLYRNTIVFFLEEANDLPDVAPVFAH